jgi:hypothetical protein
MSADPQNLRFYVDENIMGVGKALAIARKDTVHPGHRLIPEVQPGSLDTEWIPLVASRGLVVISRDRHIRTRPGEVALLREYGLRVFWIGGKRDLNNWDNLVRLVRRWPDIESVIAQQGPGPWFMVVNEHRVAPLALKGDQTYLTDTSHLAIGIGRLTPPPPGPKPPSSSGDHWQRHQRDSGSGPTA